MAVKTYSKGSTASLSKNFKVSEFACHGVGCCSTVMVDEQLVKYLQLIREHFGKSITITSGYRCEKHNGNVGGATGSRHAKGQAADIVVSGVSPSEVAKYAESIGVKGIGLYETSKDGYFVHIDTRTSKSFWYGQAQAYRSTFGGNTVNATSTQSSNQSTSTVVGTVVGAVSAKGYNMKAFVTDIQKAFGVGVDGISGPVTLSKTLTISAKVNRTHSAVKAVQKRLIALGYTEVGTADGIAGDKFTAAVKHFQRDNGCTADGEITAKNETWKKLLGIG